MALGCLLAVLPRGTSRWGAWRDLGRGAPQNALVSGSSPGGGGCDGHAAMPRSGSGLENQVLGSQGRSKGRAVVPAIPGGHGTVEPQLGVGGGRCRAAPTAHLPGLCFGAIYRAAVYICAISALHGEGARK